MNRVMLSEEMIRRMLNHYWSSGHRQQVSEHRWDMLHYYSNQGSSASA